MIVPSPKFKWTPLQITLFVLTLIFPIACSGVAPPMERSANAPELQKITFQAAFLAQGNISFTAAYVAKEKGYFAEQGLDVTIAQ